VIRHFFLTFFLSSLVVWISHCIFLSFASTHTIFLLYSYSLGFSSLLFLPSLPLSSWIFLSHTKVSFSNDVMTDWRHASHCPRARLVTASIPASTVLIRTHPSHCLTGRLTMSSLSCLLKCILPSTVSTSIIYYSYYYCVSLCLSGPPCPTHLPHPPTHTFSSSCPLARCPLFSKINHPLDAACLPFGSGLAGFSNESNLSSQ